MTHLPARGCAGPPLSAREGIVGEQFEMGTTSTQRGNHMRGSVRKLGLAGWILLGNCVLAHAGQEVSVGRVDVQLPGDGWQVYSVEDNGITLSGAGHTHQQAAEFKVIVRPGTHDVLDAVILVRANASGKGRFSGILFSDAQCRGSSRAYAEGDEPGPAARSFRCLQVAQLQSINVSSAIPGAARAWLSKNGWRLPPSMHMISAQQHANTGSFAVAVAYLRPLATKLGDFNASGIPETLPIGVTTTNVQWGRRLQEAVRDSVYSIRGKLPVPEMQFSDMAVEIPSQPAEPKLPASPVRVPVPPLSDQG